MKQRSAGQWILISVAVMTAVGGFLADWTRVLVALEEQIHPSPYPIAGDLPPFSHTLLPLLVRRQDHHAGSQRPNPHAGTSQLTDRTSCEGAGATGPRPGTEKVA
jgi:hypothetical protein